MSKEKLHIYHIWENESWVPVSVPESLSKEFTEENNKYCLLNGQKGLTTEQWNNFRDKHINEFKSYINSLKS